MTNNGDYSIQGLELDYAQRKVVIDGVIVPKPLSRKAFRLLEFLADNAGKVCARADTSEAVYDEIYVPRRDNARLDALIERTRVRLGDDQRNPRFIETVRGVGHRLNNYAQEEPSHWQAAADTRVLVSCSPCSGHEEHEKMN